MARRWAPVLSLDSLSRATHGPALVNHGRDVLAMWPHEYARTDHEYDLENAQWSRGLDWRATPGYKRGPHGDCATPDFAFNYAFDALFDFVPSGHSGNVLLFDARNVQAKMRTFYTAHKYIAKYPTARDAEDVLHCSTGYFYGQVVPAIFCMAANVNFLDFELRHWEYNHCEHFPERVTCSCDGEPQEVCCPHNRFLQRLLKSGKYKKYVVMGEYVVCVAAGFPVEYVGPHIGTRHDSRKHKENWRRRAKILPWEYWLGDKAYVGCPEFLTEIKGKNLPRSQVEYNLTIQHYRGRNEHLISEWKQARATLNTVWRGSFSLLAAIMKLSAHMCGLIERMRGPRYDCFGPWPMCPASVAKMC
jgi:hypothetical protein